MKKSIILWFTSILVMLFLMVTLCNHGYSNAIVLAPVIMLLCIKFVHVGRRDSEFAGILSLGVSLLLLFISLLLYGYIPSAGDKPWVTSLFITSALSCILFYFLFLMIDEGESRRIGIHNHIKTTSLSGYTEGDYRFPTDEELAAIH